VKEKRAAIFNAFFDQVQLKVGPIYQKLSSRGEAGFSLGGSANLFLDDKYAPFEGGVTFCPCPEGKRAVYDIDQLSGGEKTVAALALLFAMS